MQRLREPLPYELVGQPSWLIDVFHAMPPLLSYRDAEQIAKLGKGTLANLVCQDKGPSDVFMVGKKAVIPRLSFVLWLLERSEVKPQSKPTPQKSKIISMTGGFSRAI